MTNVYDLSKAKDNLSKSEPTVLKFREDSISNAINAINRNLEETTTAGVNHVLFSFANLQSVVLDPLSKETNKSRRIAFDLLNQLGDDLMRTLMARYSEAGYKTQLKDGVIRIEVLNG